MDTVNVALTGYKFMDKAHSHAWRDVCRFFDLQVVRVLKVACGRTLPFGSVVSNPRWWCAGCT